MKENQQTIINLLSGEISSALISADHYYCSEDMDRDKVEANKKGYMERVDHLRKIREQLENEFTKTIYSPI